MTTLALLLAVTFSVTTSANAQQPMKKYKNCTELRKVYSKGVAKDAKSVKATAATINAKVYLENIGSDRDKDGVACET